MQMCPRRPDTGERLLGGEQTCLDNSDMGRTHSTTSEARNRILETADRLFYRQGIRAVGIDRVIAEADVAKATLYAHFPSKDDLIVATLRRREESVRAFFRSAAERSGKRTRAKLRAF